MNLAEKDKDILETFRILIESEKPLRHMKINIPNRQDQYMLSLNSNYFSNRLSELGVVKAKTHKLTFPTYLRQDLVNHFIRGYFDGDGCISINKNTPTISIASTDIFCEELSRIIFDKCSITPSIQCPHKERNVNTRVLTFGGRFQANKFFDYLYNDATIFLQRKYDKFIVVRKFRVIEYAYAKTCMLCEKKHYCKGYCQYHYCSEKYKIEKAKKCLAT